MLRKLVRRITRNPVLIGSAIVAIVELGMDITDEQTAAIAVVVGMVVRQLVTPVSDPRLPAGE